MIKIFKILFYFLLSLGCLQNANAADIRPMIHGTGSYRTVVIEGLIEKGDFERFINIVKENQGEISGIYIFSPGGDFDEAMKIGRAVRALELSSMVPMRDASDNASCEKDGLSISPIPKNIKNCTCASACFFIHIGGVHRGGTFLAVHRPYFEKGDFGKLSEQDAKREFDALQDRAHKYMSEMSVPAYIQEDVLGTSSDNRLILDEKTVKTHFWGELPYIHEWKKNKCSVFSDNESIRMELYGQQILNGSYKKLSDAEQNDFESLKAKQEKEQSCALELNQERRTAAYEKFFGAKPNNANSHNFSKWSEATKYLGMNFYDILSEEKFEESEFRTKFVQVTSLQRAATAQAPFIHLSDSPERLRTVSSVSLASPPHPTDDFLEKLLQSLKAVWGEPLKKNDDDQWFWDRGKFTAKLQKIVSAEGPAWTLKIEAKDL